MSPQDTAENTVSSPAGPRVPAAAETLGKSAENGQKGPIPACGASISPATPDTAQNAPFTAHNGLETPIQAGSPRLQAGAESVRTEAQVRAVRARRARLEADLIEEGASDAMVARLATDETAGRIVAHERRVIDQIAAMFGGVRA